MSTATVAEDQTAIDKPAIARRVFVSTKTISRLIKSDPKFPKPLPMFKRLKRWRLADIIRYFEGDVAPCNTMPAGSTSHVPMER